MGFTLYKYFLLHVKGLKILNVRLKSFQFLRMSAVYKHFEKFSNSVVYPFHEYSPNETFKCNKCFEKYKSDYETAYNEFVNTNQNDLAKKSKTKKNVSRIEIKFRSRVTTKTTSNLIKHLQGQHANDLYMQFLIDSKTAPVNMPSTEAPQLSSDLEIISNDLMPNIPSLLSCIQPSPIVAVSLHGHMPMPTTPVRPAKRLRFDSNGADSPVSTPLGSPNVFKMNITRQLKYSMNSNVQKERFSKLLKMLIKCMLPISIVENAAFREYIEYLDPSFNMPSVYTVKYKGLSELSLRVEIELSSALSKLRYINIALDLWTDATMRSFIGFVAQGNTVSVYYVHIK